MEFPVPQFIEMEAKIVGPLTWRQFLYFLVVGLALFFLWFVIKHLLWFIMIAIFLAGGAAALAFLPIAGQPLPTFLKNFFFYSIRTKIYLWQKKKMPPKVIYEKKVKIGKEELIEASRLKIGEGGRLRDLSTQIETRTK